MKRVRCFFAYSSTPPALAETVETAIGRLKTDSIVTVIGWRDLRTTGKLLISKICEAIERSEIFACDLTTLNNNVLFELGFAIAKNRRIWVIRDPSFERRHVDFEKLRLMTTVGYKPYSNSREIVKSFYAEQPYEDLQDTVLSEVVAASMTSTQAGLLYLKSSIQTDASIKLSRILDTCPVPQVVDDPGEEIAQPLQWYAEQTRNSLAVVAHLLSEDRVNARFHNAKAAFVSGLAYGFGKQLLMLAHSPYYSPIDYRHLLQIHQTASQCEGFARDWIKGVADSWQARARSAEKYEEHLRRHAELRDIALGEYIAEYESELLQDYFVETSIYQECLRTRYKFLVGRRGSGKTAILLKLAHELGRSIGNHVCVVQPKDYDLQGLVRFLDSSLPGYNRGSLIESLWKALLYSELARSVRLELKNRPPGAIDSTEEAFLQSIHTNHDLVASDFTVRLETLVRRYADPHRKEVVDRGDKLTESLHQNAIPELRTELKKVLEKRDHVLILIDNLDKAWKPEAYLSLLKDLLFGLLNASNEMANDLAEPDYLQRVVDLSVIVFLRSDIFTQIMQFARERDKIPYRRIAWRDPDTLLRVIEERFLASAPLIHEAEGIWNRYFCRSVNGVLTREYLVRIILPRPRDLIYVVKAALAFAVNRAHTIIEEEDILDAQKEYSQHALYSIVDETTTQFERLEDFLYEFLQSKEVVGRRDILRAMDACRVPEAKVNDLVEVLCDLAFFGRELEPGRFEFLYNYQDREKFHIMAQRTAQSAGHDPRFRINVPFHSYLEIQPVLQDLQT